MARKQIPWDKIHEDVSNRKTGELTPLQKKRFARPPVTMTAGYSYENGIGDSRNRDLAELKRRDPDEYNRQAYGTIVKNSLSAAKYGHRYRDYPLERAEANTKKRQQLKQEQAEKKKKFQRYVNGLSYQKK